MVSCVDHCPLCESNNLDEYFQDCTKRSQRVYLQCEQCSLVFVPPRFYLSAEDEKAEYDRHNNDVNDDGYRRFLNRLWEPLQAHLKPNDAVLDFGCGPGPLLAKMMEESGMQVSTFDHFYQPDQSVLKSAYYDAITSTEVIEHLHQPKQVFEHWLSMLKPQGRLGIMTKLVTNKDAFATWHYKNDLTHVCFFSESSFRWLAQQYGVKLTIHGRDVMIFEF